MLDDKNKTALSSSPIALIEYGVQQAFYPNDETGEYEYVQTEKAVKFFVISTNYINRRINFYLPKSLLEKRDGLYTHIKHHGIKVMRSNIAKAVAESEAKWAKEKENFDKRKKGGAL